MTISSGIAGSGVNIILPSMSGMKGWAVGALVMMAMPMAWRWSQRVIPRALAGWVLGAARKALEGKGIADEDLQLLVNHVVLELVRYAEKKLPDAGLGAARMALVEAVLGALPGMGMMMRWIILRYPDQWRELVESCVKEMDSTAKKLLNPDMPGLPTNDP